MSDLECPYCGAEHEINHDDGFGYEESVSHEDECKECGKSFIFHTSIRHYFSPEKADCLNGGPCEYDNWRYLWKNDSGSVTEYRMCKSCGREERRNL